MRARCQSREGAAFRISYNIAGVPRKPPLHTAVRAGLGAATPGFDFASMQTITPEWNGPGKGSADSTRLSTAGRQHGWAQARTMAADIRSQGPPATKNTPIPAPAKPRLRLRDTQTRPHEPRWMLEGYVAAWAFKLCARLGRSSAC